MVLVSRHYPAVTRFFVNKVGFDCEDLIQATFCALLESRERFRGDCSFRTYLFVIARRKLYKHLEGLERAQARRGRYDPDHTPIVELVPDIVTLMNVKREQGLLLAALRRLPISSQLMLELRYWESCSLRTIAGICGEPLGTVKSTMSRARKLLEGELAALARTPEEYESTLGGLERWAAELREQLSTGARLELTG